MMLMALLRFPKSRVRLKTSKTTRTKRMAMTTMPTRSLPLSKQIMLASAKITFYGKEFTGRSSGKMEGHLVAHCISLEIPKLDRFSGDDCFSVVQN
jgi:hypothetical protein